MDEVVYAIHPFEAESEDEVSFEFGQPIIVLEKDELYGDGWWKGKNIHGRIGLFPMNHTSYSKPAPRKPETNTNSFYNQMVATPNETSNSNNLELNNLELNLELNNNLELNLELNNPSPLFRMPTPSIEETIDDIQNKLRKMSVKPNEKQLNQDLPESQQYQWSPKQTRRSKLFLSSSSSRSVSSISSSSHRQSTESTKIPPLRQPIQTKDHPSTWDVRQVCRWLDEVGFGSEINNFIDNDITGDVLLELHLSTLKELNVVSFGKRVHIMNAINALKAKHSIGAVTDDDISDIEEQSIYSPTPVYRFQPKYNSSSSPTLGKFTANQEFRKFPGLPLSPRNSAGNRRAHPNFYSQLKPIDDVNVTNDIETIDPKPKKSRILSKWSSLRKPKEKRSSEINLNNGKKSQEEIRNQFVNDNIRPNSPSLDKSKGLLFNRRKYSERNSMVENPVVPKQSLDMDLEVLKSMGEPDYEGWLKKQGDKYKTWKSRYFILKGVDLYYLKNNKHIQHPKLKGHIDLTGYRILTDENILPGKYGFKIVHDVLRTHFFAHEDIDVMRGWVKAMMKATISRDHNAPVISSSNINTVPLADARKMSPRPPQPRRPSFSAAAVISKIDSPVLRVPSPTYIKQKPNYITTMGSSSSAYIQNTAMYPK
ncbi:24135_t:CDS:10 [Dentiscutata erythropus]|uniref:24135_t:CDS:1 n=1 Tax=Dentiscutata erythropus TaxID=1348616 RepID=A0A9N9HWI8_9GLOM|nr:24135_t:CDS:10 [Dentiscutata erythropus]